MSTNFSIKNPTTFFTIHGIFFSIFIFTKSTGSGAPLMANGSLNEDDSTIEPNFVCTFVKSVDALKVLAEDAVDWAHHNGLITRVPEHPDRSDTAQIHPFALFPSPFPRKYFKQAVDVQTAMNLLYFRVARDYKFLMNAYKDVLDTDPAIRAYMDIVREAHEAGTPQPITMLVQRADYMLNVIKDDHGHEDYELKQVEVNGSALGGPGLSVRITDLHRRTLSKVGKDASYKFVPKNNTDKVMAEAIYLAWELFADPNALLIVVVSKTHNPYQFEERQIEYEIERLSKGRIDIVRLTQSECNEKLELADDHSLRFDGRVVGVVFNQIYIIGSKYYEDRMAARRKMELSTAIKIPSMALAMSTSKKVQQMLAMPGVLERFFPTLKEAHFVTAIRKTFAQLWGMENDDAETRRVIKDAIAHPEHYVMKPNREGGGHNFFDQDIADNLLNFTREQRAAHILMQRLQPMAVKNYMVRAFNEPKLDFAVGELGVFGFLVGNLHNGRVLYNKQAGHVMRSKWASVNEAGVSAGSGMIDSPYLV